MGFAAACGRPLNSLVELAGKTDRTDTELDQLAMTWATLTLPLSKRAYEGLKFKPRRNQAKQYEIKFANKKNYLKSKSGTQQRQIVLAGHIWLNS